MPKVVETVCICRACGKRYTFEEYKALPKTILVQGGSEWPTCTCGGNEISITDDGDE